MTLYIFVIYLLLTLSHSTFTRFHKRYSLQHRDFELSTLTYQRVIPSNYVKNSPTFNITKPLTYQAYDLINYRFIGAGASGQVFLMQDLETSQFSILKRYFKEGRFEEENYIMEQMGYPIKWGRDPVYNNTVSIFPWTESRSLSQVLLDARDIKIVMYKIILELNRTVSKGFFHMDIKPLNIIVDSTYEDGDYVTKKSKIMVIDWNLVNFYYEGAQFNFRRGTSCYQAPELIIWSKYYTPNVDVWSLGISMYYIITGKKPLKSCSKQALAGLIKFVGYDKFKEFYDSMRVESDRQILKIMRENADAPGEQQLLLDNNPTFDQQTIDILKRMLVLDPAQRASFHQLLSDPYFDDVKNLSPPYYQKQKKKRAKHQEFMNMAQEIL